MIKYFVQTTTGTWDEVNEYVYLNRKYVFNDDDTARYTDQAVIAGDTVELKGKVTLTELGEICRFVGATIPTHSFGSKGLVRTPEFLKIKKGNSNILHSVATGENWRKAS